MALRYHFCIIMAYGELIFSKNSIYLTNHIIYCIKKRVYLRCIKFRIDKEKWILARDADLLPMKFFHVVFANITGPKIGYWI